MKKNIISPQCEALTQIKIQSIVYKIFIMKNKNKHLIVPIHMNMERQVIE